MPGAVTIRQLDDSVKARLRVQAAQHGRSMEEEAREILKTALETKPAERVNLAESIRRRVAPLGGIELQIPHREPIRKVPNFAK